MAFSQRAEGKVLAWPHQCATAVFERSTLSHSSCGTQEHVHKDSQVSGAVPDALPVFGLQSRDGVHGYPGSITSPNIPDTSTACLETWKARSMIPGLYTFQMYLYRADSYIATNETVNPYFLPNPSSAFASVSGLPTNCTSTVICATQGEQDHRTYSDDK